MMFLRPLLIAAAMLAMPALVSAQAEPEARVIVRFKPQADSVRAKALSLRATRGEAREVAQTRATALGLRQGQQLSAGLSLDERTHVVTATGLSSAALARKLAADPEVEMVAVDGRRKHLGVASAPNDPLFGGVTPAPTAYIGQFYDAGDPSANPPVAPQLRDTYSRTIDQWYLKAPSTVTSGGSATGEVVSNINVLPAWGLTTGASSIVVAVLDTGVRRDHPDFIAANGTSQFLSGYDMIGSTPASAGSTATAIANRPANADLTLALDYGDWVSQADIDGGKLGSGCTSTDIGNSSWHGTRVSGLIAALAGNGRGMSGVAPGVKILPVRVLGKCGGYDSDIIAGIKWAVGLAVPGVPANTNKAKVLNMSLGGSGSCAASDSTGKLYRDVIAQANAQGATIVVAAGNSEGQAVGLPGNCPGVVTVTALRHVGTKVGFASVGPEVTIAAPGGNCVNLAVGYPCLYTMVSTTNSGATSPVANDESYTNGNASVGTSFSAPVVSGVVALMASVRPALTSAEATAALRKTARPFPTTGGGSASAATPPACVAPTAAKQDECYCTTSTCGAGMADAAAAVAAAQALNAATVAITPSSTSLTAMQSATLTAAVTGLAAGKTVASTNWTLLDGGTAVSAFNGGADTATVSLTPGAAGSFTVQADITDSDGFVHSQTASFSVAAAAVTTPSSSGGGGGGGAVSAAWLAALLLAAVSLKRPTPRLQRCRP
ncbi:S8 family serine peptidase [Roseateles sp. BYS78W]|uniref:S8 family serine peptidase n=1 Tax=Pelomonas candidula TaxID=3299025 RepID=A0ABW7H9N8_9BURK